MENKELIEDMLDEASNLSAYEKMDLFNRGQRRENVKACGDQKLFDYRRICQNNNFNVALDQIEAEMVARGLISTSQTRLAQTSAAQQSNAPKLISIIAEDFYIPDALFVKEHPESKAIIERYMAETGTIKKAIVALIFALCLKHPQEVIDELKTFITVNCGISKNELKAIISSCLSDPEILKRIELCVRGALSYHEDLEEGKKKKKPYSSMSITTGDIAYNIAQFNKRMGTNFPGNDNNNPSTAEAQAAAAKANNAVSDGAGDASSSSSAGEGSGIASGGDAGASAGEGAGMGESLKEGKKKFADVLIKVAKEAAKKYNELDQAERDWLEQAGTSMIFEDQPEYSEILDPLNHFDIEDLKANGINTEDEDSASDDAFWALDNNFWEFTKSATESLEATVDQDLNDNRQPENEFDLEFDKPLDANEVRKHEAGIEEDLDPMKAWYDAALAIAKQNNKPVIYGYFSKGKYNQVDPIICDDMIACNREFMKKYHPSGSILIAYPDKPFVEEVNEGLKEELKKVTTEEDLFDLYYNNWLDCDVDIDDLHGSFEDGLSGNEFDEDAALEIYGWSDAYDYLESMYDLGKDIHDRGLQAVVADEIANRDPNDPDDKELLEDTDIIK